MELSTFSPIIDTAVICSSAIACATVANQPTYDSGGFPIDIRKILCGSVQPWEVFSDQVTIVALETVPSERASLSLSVSSSEPDAPSLPGNINDNSAGRSVLKALSIIQSRGIKWRWRLHIVVRKGISLKGTGLGSSGASAAAGLKAFEGLLRQLPEEISFSDQERIQILTIADADVPDNSIPAYSGGWILLDRHIPDRWERMKINPAFGRWVIACPRGFGIKTSLARAVLQPIVPDQRLAVDEMKLAVASGDNESYGRLMEQAHAWFVSPRSRLYPDTGKVYDHVYQSAKEAGALGVSISGAGPGIVALVRNDDDAMIIASAMHAAFQSCGFDSVALLADIGSSGAITVPPFSYDVP